VSPERSRQADLSAAHARVMSETKLLIGKAINSFRRVGGGQRGYCGLEGE